VVGSAQFNGLRSGLADAIELLPQLFRGFSVGRSHVNVFQVDLIISKIVHNSGSVMVVPSVVLLREVLLAK
jgi:hypothetical protein